MNGRATPERLADLIADRMVPKLADELAARLGEQGEAGSWITPAEAARRYGFTARWWRQRVDEYGRREGDGPKPRIMLSVGRIEGARGGREAAW